MRFRPCGLALAPPFKFQLLGWPIPKAVLAHRAELIDDSLAGLHRRIRNPNF